MVDQSLQGGVRILQYRNKSASPVQRARQAALLTDLCRRYDALYIINDDIELARQIGADGVHLGRDDAPVEFARRLLGRESVIGVSCYNELALARSAAAAGANYVAFGAVFASVVKPDAKRARLNLFEDAKRVLPIPTVAIGGISLVNARAVLTAGADSIAVISALFCAPVVEDAARALCAVFNDLENLPARAGA